MGRQHRISTHPRNEAWETNEEECGSIVRCNQARSLPTRTTISQLTCPLRNIGESARKTAHRAMPIAQLTRWVVQHAAEPTPVGTIFRREIPTEGSDRLFRPRVPTGTSHPKDPCPWGCRDVGGRRRQAGLDPLGRPCLDLHPPPKMLKKNLAWTAGTIQVFEMGTLFFFLLFS